jgi:hypothetical protein
VKEEEEQIHWSDLSRSPSFLDGEYAAEIIVRHLETPRAETTDDGKVLRIRENLLKYRILRLGYFVRIK